MTPDRWVEAVRGILSEHAGVEVEDVTNGAAIPQVSIKHPAGGWVTLFLGSKVSTRGYSLGIASHRPRKTSGMYTGQNWHRRLIREAWAELDKVARS